MCTIYHKSLLCLLGLILLLACGCTAPPPVSDYVWSLPKGTSPPLIPADNPITQDKVELGRRLFYDKRLSGNQTQSCASCHLQRLAFTDGKRQAIGSTGETHPRSSMSLANVGYRTHALNWANPIVKQLEQQALTPLFGEFPIELGLIGREQEAISRLTQDATYQRLFSSAFPEYNGTISIQTITKAVATFQRTLLSRNAPYDQWTRGNQQALSTQAKQGKDLFFSTRLNCFRCHGGPDFNQPHNADNQPVDSPFFHNTGLYNLDGNGLFPKGGHGLFEISLQPGDMGKFRAPTLRNIDVTAPYMHDGSIPDLRAVLAHYAAGGRHITTGPHQGDGRTNPYKSQIIKGFSLTKAETDAVIAFLKSLTDTTFLQHPAHSDPTR